MRVNPGFSTIAVGVMALGIAANTAIFTVVNSVLLQPLPYTEPSRLMQLGRLYPGPEYGWSNSIPKYMEWRRNDAFESIALFGQGGPGMNLGAGDRPEQVKALRASDGYFKVFGVAPLIGRTYTAVEDLPGGPKVAAITYDLWQNCLGGNPSIVGSTILLNSEPYCVISILQRGFQLDPPADVFLPISSRPELHESGPLSAHGRTPQAGRDARSRACPDESRGRTFPRTVPEEYG
jgi:hypothetical protein